PYTTPCRFDLAGVPDGDYTFGVRATDPVGNTGPVSSDAYTLDTTGPDTTITVKPPSPGNDLTPAWSFTTEAGATTECRLTGPSGLIAAFSACTSPATYDLTGQPDGDYQFSVRATDPVGNTGPVSSDTYSLDTTGPDTTITEKPPSPESDRTPT